MPDLLPPAGWSALFAGLALCFSVYIYLSSRIEKRKAGIEISRQKQQLPESSVPAWRILVKNHGPARADKVNVRLDYDKEDSRESVELRKIPSLQVGQTYYFYTHGAQGAERATVRWKDKRFRTQEVEYWLSTRYYL